MKSTQIKDVQTKNSTIDAYLCFTCLHGVHLYWFERDRKVEADTNEDDWGVFSKVERVYIYS